MSDFGLNSACILRPVMRSRHAQAGLRGIRNSGVELNSAQTRKELAEITSGMLKIRLYSGSTNRFLLVLHNFKLLSIFKSSSCAQPVAHNLLTSTNA